MHIGTIFVDAHVHLYECFDINQFLNSTWKNFAQLAQKQNIESFVPILLLTESKQNFFQMFKQQATGSSLLGNNVKDWTFQCTQENLSLTACNQHQQKIYLIAGQQVVTQENLEVLALITDESFADGLPLEDTVQDIVAKGGIPVIPWGFGKWMGQRKQVLNRFLKHHSGIFLGDNSGRPVWFCPPYFRQAERRILPGTDPLPLASQVNRPGSFGFTIQGNLSLEEPGLQLKQMLLDPQTNLHPYGSLESPWRFIRNQFALRLSSSSRI